MDMQRKKQIRFSDNDDITLLKSVLDKNPFRLNNWADVAQSTGLFIDARRARERTNLILDHRRAENITNLNSSGVAEVYGERETLLDEVLNIRDEEEREKRLKKQQIETDERNGREIRKRAAERLTPRKDSEGDSATPTKKSSKTSILVYLSTKSENELKLKEEEILLRKEELELAKARFQLEKEERLAKIAADKQQNNLMLQLMSQVLNSKKLKI